MKKYQHEKKITDTQSLKTKTKTERNDKKDLRWVNFSLSLC